MFNILSILTNKTVYIAIAIAAVIATIAYLMVTKASLETKVTKLKEQNTVLTAKYDKLTNEMLTLQANIAKKEAIAKQLEEERLNNIIANSDLTNEQVTKMYLFTTQKRERQNAIKKDPKKATKTITDTINRLLHNITDNTRTDIPQRQHTDNR